MKIIPIIILTIYTALSACGSVYADTWVIGIDQITPFLQGLNSNIKNNTKPRTLQKEVRREPKTTASSGSTSNKINKPLSFRISLRKNKKDTFLNLVKPKLKKTMQLVPEHNISFPPGLNKTSSSIAMKPIMGNTNGLPMMDANFNNTPLWKIIQMVHEKTGYKFDTNNINLGLTKTLRKKDINLAVLLNILFPDAKVYIYPKKREVKINEK